MTGEVTQQHRNMYKLSIEFFFLKFKFQIFYPIYIKGIKWISLRIKSRIRENNSRDTWGETESGVREKMCQ